MAEGIPLIVQKSNTKNTSKIKNGKSQGNENKSGKAENKSFAEIVEKAGKENKSTGSKGELKLLKFVSQVVKKIRETLPDNLKSGLLSFVKKLIQHTKFTEKEKGDILTSLLQALKKKDNSRGLEKITELLAALDTEIRGAVDKNSLLKNINKAIDEVSKDSKKKQDSTGISKLIVIDLRKGKDGKNQVQAKGEHPGSTEINHNGDNGQGITKSEGAKEDVLYFSLKDGENSRQQEVDFIGTNKQTQVFDQEMINKLKNSLKNEVVKQTKIILRENGKGEIRIVLKPESLGRVRMRVQMQNNHIDGRIFVENNSIKEIFESTLNNLNTALKQEGFDSISLKVSVGDGNQQQQQEKSSEYTQPEAAEEFEKNIPVLFDPGVDYSRINLFI